MVGLHLLASAALALAGCGQGTGLVTAGEASGEDGGIAVVAEDQGTGHAPDAGRDAGAGSLLSCDAGSLPSSTTGTSGSLPPPSSADAGSHAVSGEHDAGSATPPASAPDAGSAPVEVVDAGPPPVTGEPDAGSVAPPIAEEDAGPPAPEPIDAGPVTPPSTPDAGSTPPAVVDAGSTTTGTTWSGPGPSFGSWAWGAPDTTAVVHAGFQWFESGYPGTLAASDNAYLAQNGVVPFAYINMAEVPDDTYLQGQIGSFWQSIALCVNTGWNSTVVDVRDSRWQDWLVRRANAAYALGNRGIKWDVAHVEDLCNGWSGVGGTAPQQAIDAMASVLSTLKAQHPDLKFIVNQGYALAEQYPGLIDGFEMEDMIHYADSNSGDTWASETIARVGSIHTNGHIPIFDLEYYDLFGCSDTTCAYANQLYSQIVALDWVPYITVVDMNVQGRGLNITAPW